LAQLGGQHGDQTKGLRTIGCILVALVDLNFLSHTERSIPLDFLFCFWNQMDIQGPSLAIYYVVVVLQYVLTKKYLKASTSMQFVLRAATTAIGSHPQNSMFVR